MQRTNTITLSGIVFYYLLLVFIIMQNFIATIIGLSLFCLSSQTYAGTPTIWTNNLLKMTITATTNDANLRVCNYDESECLSFKPIVSKDKKSTYTEINGTCEFTMEIFNHNHKDGTTKNEFMLDIMYQVLRVTNGESNCQLKSEFSGKRSLTGIYL